MPPTELDNVLAMLRASPIDLKAPQADLRAAIDRMGEVFPVPEGVTVAPVTLAGIAAEHIVAKAGGPLVLYLHGGGYVIGSPKSHRHLVCQLAHSMAGEAYSLDYRMAPEAPFPAAVDDAVDAYQALIAAHPGRGIVIAGDSAGGGLAFAAALGAAARGLPRPAAVVGLSPWVNLGTDNESYDALERVDPMLSRAAIDYFSSHYLAGNPASDPAASPLFADLKGLPPVLIQIGDSECFLGDAVKMHHALVTAGVHSELSVWKQMFHVWHAYWPMLRQGREAIDEIADFVARHVPANPHNKSNAL